MRILLLEDEESIRGFVRINLKRNDMEVTEAENGEDALEFAASRGPFDIALLDVMLPTISGFEVCERLRGQYPGMGIIMLTAKSQEEDKIYGLELGADDYVQKPFSPGELIARIKSLYRRMNAGTAPHKSEAASRADGNGADGAERREEDSGATAGARLTHGGDGAASGADAGLARGNGVAGGADGRLEHGNGAASGADAGLARGNGVAGGADSRLEHGNGAASGADAGLARGNGVAGGTDAGLAHGNGVATGEDSRLARGNGAASGADAGLAHGNGVATGEDSRLTRANRMPAAENQSAAERRQAQEERTIPEERAAASAMRGQGDAEWLRQEKHALASGPFRLSVAQRKLWKDGREIVLTPTEWTLVRLLMEREGESVSRDHILNEVWGRYYVGDLKVVDVNIRRIRQKIECNPSEPSVIETVWGYGYRWKRSVQQ